jgi:hypothetical protein
MVGRILGFPFTLHRLAPERHRGTLFTLFLLVLLVRVSYSAPAMPSAQIQAMVDEADRCERNGLNVRADSLFAALDAAHAMNADYLLRWVQIARMLGDEAKMTGLCCRVAAVDPRLADIAFFQLSIAVENSPPDSVAAVMAKFRECIFSLRDIDTLRMQLLLADFFGRHDMEREEIDALAAVQGSSGSLAPRLLDLARSQLGRGRCEKAIVPARFAWERTVRPSEKAAAAALLYRAFAGLHKSDSALRWLKRTDSSSVERRIDEAVLYQEQGMAAEARAMIEKIPPSFERDTVAIRECIFEGKAGAAAETLHAAKGRWTSKPEETFLWRTRLMLFFGEFDSLAVLFDHLPVHLSSVNAKELLACRYRLQLFQRSGSALEAWSAIATALYTGNCRRAVEILSKTGELPADMAISLRLLVIQDMLNRDDLQGALALFQKPTGGAVRSAEYLYRFADVELKNGRIGPAHERLLAIIRDYPNDIFAERARVLLSSLDRK